LKHLQELLHAGGIRVVVSGGGASDFKHLQELLRAGGERMSLSCAATLFRILQVLQWHVMPVNTGEKGARGKRAKARTRQGQTCNVGIRSPALATIFRASSFAAARARSVPMVLS